MQKAKKLPSGNYRIRVQKLQNGVKIEKSFTAPTKRAAEELALAWSKEEPKQNIITIEKAIDSYMRAKTPVLSPSTIRGYNACIKKLTPLYEVDIDEISNAMLQTFVSQMVIDGSSPKTIRNVYGFLIGVINFVRPDLYFKVTLPQKEKRVKTVPTEQQVRLLLNNAPSDLKLAILLGVCMLRRGEVCALKYGDVSSDMRMIRIHADIVNDENGAWVYKDKPKTVGSNRSITVPQEVIDMIGTGNSDDFIFSFTPAMLTKRFDQLRDSLGLNCRFHDLRSFGCSFTHFLRIPDSYVLSMGGWSENGNVMRELYRTSFDEKMVKFSKISNDYISKNLLG